MKVLLVEKNDFGGGTSANSLKTIHGGLRYLQSLDVASSIISARERKAWLTIAPNLVRPLACVLPTTKDIMKSKLFVGSGALFYNVLTAGRNSNMPFGSKIPNAHLISLSTLNKIIPRLADNRVTGGACWYDAQVVNTERLVLSIVLAAKQLGAQVENYQKIESLTKQNGEYEVQLAASQTHSSIQYSAKYVVDCSGRASYLERECLNLSKMEQETASSFVKAVNLVIGKKISNHAFGIKAKDGSGMTRLLFTAPWQGRPSNDDFTLVGTWYFTMDPHEDGFLSQVELEQCIAQINSAFEQSVCSAGDVVQVHVGYLPADLSVVASRGADAGLVKHAKLYDWGKGNSLDEGLYTLKGTKFTLARKAAEDTVNALQKKYDLHLSRSKSAVQPLWKESDSAIDGLRKVNLTEEQVQFLLTYFVMGIQKITEICEINSEMRAALPGADNCCKAVVEYCLRYEYVFHLTDLLVRRLPIGNGKAPSEYSINYCVEVMSAYFGWNNIEMEAEIAELKSYYMKRN